jgi:ABC-type sugar transport system ATPase subunit
LGDIILELKNISKSFPGVKALDDVSFAIERGTVHALVGENGAGKSTLIKILAGIYHPEAGEVLLDGKLETFKAPIDSQMKGISVVHQELKLSETLTVAKTCSWGTSCTKTTWWIGRACACARRSYCASWAFRWTSTRRFPPCPWRKNRWWRSARPSTATAKC